MSAFGIGDTLMSRYTQEQPNRRKAVMRLQTASSARNAAGLSNDHRHVVQFYEDDEFLFEAVSGFLIQGLKAGQPTVVFARPETRRACAARIERNGCDYSGAIQ